MEKHVEMVLDTSEYDKNYFDGELVDNPHPAGYGSYSRNPKTYSGRSRYGAEAERLIDKHVLDGAKVLVLGCAKGFLVDELRNRGVDAYGVDVSSYAVNNAPSSVQGYLTVADARNQLDNYGTDEFDTVLSRHFFSTIPESDAASIVSKINVVSKHQVHIFAESPDSNYYTDKSLDWWSGQGFEKGTVLREADIIPVPSDASEVVI